MLSFIKKIFRVPTADWPRSVPDGVLGELRLADDADRWKGGTTVGDRTIGFMIGGKAKPDARLIAHAHDITQSLPAFEKSVAAFLADEARSRRDLAQFADEIRQLTIEEVCLFWPDRPDDGMIYFNGPNEIRVWRCDYVARKPRRLGFDS